MTLKGDISKSEHIDWKYIPLTIQKLELNKQYKICLIVAFGCFFGLRLKSILNIRWEDVLNKESFEIKDKNKIRTVFVINDIRNLVNRIYSKLGSPEVDKPIFLNNSGKQVLSPQYVNKQVKVLFTKYEIPYGNLSSDSFIKTFCIKYLESKDFSADAKKWISKILGHASWSITANFLGYAEDFNEKQNYDTFSMDV
jgi:integrase